MKSNADILWDKWLKRPGSVLPWVATLERQKVRAAAYTVCWCSCSGLGLVSDG